jgi:hypothetical protein
MGKAKYAGQRQQQNQGHYRVISIHYWRKQSAENEQQHASDPEPETKQAYSPASNPQRPQDGPSFLSSTQSNNSFFSKE